MSDRPLNEDELELAALYALSALSAPEMEALERERREHAAFWAEVRSLRDAAAGLAESGPRARPRRDLWPAIRARIGAAEPRTASAPSDVPAQVWKSWRATSEPDAGTIAARDGAFEPTDIPGIRVRRLHVDEEAERVTMLVRMDAGTAYPAHRHGGAEECYVLEGDLEIVGQQELHAGDYQRMETGSLHPLQRTRKGCLLLITSSSWRELVA
ncbi:MAG: cupin domain-containing protein [Planctomycetota bacterium]